MRVYVLGCSLLVLATQSAASVLTKENEPLLCHRTASGEQIVDSDQLAQAITSRAGAELLLDGANVTGQRDGAVQVHSSATRLGEPAYAILASKSRDSTSERPFGPNVDLATNDAAKDARDQILAELTDLYGQFMLPGKLSDGPVEYRLQPRSAGSAAPDEGPYALFGSASPYVISCHVTPADVAAADQPREPTPRPGWDTRIVLRGAVDDLSVETADLKDAEPASLQFDRDKEADTKSFKINGILGFRVRDPSGTVDYIPYLSYQHTGATGSDDDIEKISPGFLLGYKWETPTVSVITKVEASAIFDLQQHSRQGKLRVYIDPTFRLGDGPRWLFGTNLAPIGPLVLRPELTLIIDATKVFRAGGSAELAKADSYFGFGGELSLRSHLELGRPISDIVFKGGVRNLFLTGDIDRNHVRRWFGSAEYAPEDFPNVGVAFQFTSGRNDDTFQKERTYGVGVTLRY